MQQAALTIALFGGSGQTGQAVIAAALKRRYRVKALVRQSGSLQNSDPGIEEICGDLLSAADVRRTLAGAEAAIITFGPRPPFKDIFCEAATKSIIEAAKQSGPRRLVCLTGAMIGDYPENQSYFFGLLKKLGARHSTLTFQDRAAQEQQVRQSDLNWTIVKPPRLTNSPGTGRIVAGKNIKIGLMASISRQDLAEVLLDQCGNDTAEKILFVKNL